MSVCSASHMFNYKLVVSWIRDMGIASNMSLEWKLLAVNKDTKVDKANCW